MSLEHFAQVCALIDDGFIAPDDVLAWAGIDVPGWRALRLEWLSRLTSSEAPTLAQQFGRAYARARRQVASLLQGRPANETACQHAGSLLEHRPANELAREVDAGAVRVDAMDGTMEHAFPLAGPALPFKGSGFGALAAPVDGGALPAIRPSCYAATGSHEATLEVAGVPSPRRAVLPFVSPRGDGRRMRLQRFDTQTGRQLSTPLWVDEPTPAR